MKQEGDEITHPGNDRSTPQSLDSDSNQQFASDTVQDLLADSQRSGCGTRSDPNVSCRRSVFSTGDSSEGFGTSLRIPVRDSLRE
jgi:hypothetical protein